jgi:hypothetical protein
MRNIAGDDRDVTIGRLTNPEQLPQYTAAASPATPDGDHPTDDGDPWPAQKATMEGKIAGHLDDFQILTGTHLDAHARVLLTAWMMAGYSQGAIDTLDRVSWKFGLRDHDHHDDGDQPQQPEGA